MRPAFLLPALLTALLSPVTSVLNPVTSVLSALPFGPLVVHDVRLVIPTGFAAIGLADPDQILNLRIALTQNNISGLETILYEVSTPGSPSYSKYLSKDEVRKIFDLYLM